MTAPRGRLRRGGVAATPVPPNEPGGAARPGVRIAGTALAELRARAAAAYPLECCGALAGHASGVTTSGVPTPAVLLKAVPLENEAPDRRGCRFLITAATVRAVERGAAREGLDIVGFYHSHPDHPARPSARDLAHAWPWYTYVIVGVRRGEVGPARAWRLRDDRAAFDEAELVAFAGGP